jgi:cyclopropane-fatty-acyl-phospholipid synthase
MVYSSGLFDEPEPGPNMASQFLTRLDQAQMTKLRAIGDRLQLEEGQRVLEIGCGWGTLAAALADGAGVAVEAISLSDEQLDYARERWGAANLAVDFRKQDYRDVEGQFDAIASVEMVEAVGREYWPDFLDCIARCLKPGGRAAIQYIMIRDELFDAYAASADFIQAYIFPGGMLLRESEFRSLAEERGLEWHDPRHFGEDYARTLKMWRAHFDLAVEEGTLPAGFDQQFIDLWRYYLMYCEGGFRGGGIDVAQVTLVKPA